jgi:hypothetical protein
MSNMSETENQVYTLSAITVEIAKLIENLAPGDISAARFKFQQAFPEGVKVQVLDTIITETGEGEAFILLYKKAFGYNHRKSESNQKTNKRALTIATIV